MYKLLKAVAKDIKKNLGEQIIKQIDRKNNIKIDNKRVLINDCQKIGNYVFKTPLIRGLAKAGYKVDIMASDMTAELAEANPNVSGILKDGSYKKKSINIFLNIMFALKHSRRYHTYIDCTGSPTLRELLMMKLLKCERVVGVERKRREDFKIMDVVVPLDNHASGTSVAILKALGIEEEATYDLELKTDKYKDMTLEKPLVLFNWKGSKMSKTLSKEERERVIANISNIDDLDFRVIEREDTVTDLCSLIKRASMVITVDTGVVHIASAYEIPTIVHTNTGDYYLPTSKKSWVLDLVSEDLKNFIVMNFENSILGGSKVRLSHS